MEYLDFSKEAFILLLFNVPPLFLKQVSLTAAGVQPRLQQCRWQLLIFIKKHFKYILWPLSDLGIRCAMRAGQSMMGNQISELYQSKTGVYARRLWFINNTPQSHVCVKYNTN